MLRQRALFNVLKRTPISLSSSLSNRSNNFPKVTVNRCYSTKDEKSVIDDQFMNLLMDIGSQDSQPATPEEKAKLNQVNRKTDTSIDYESKERKEKFSSYPRIREQHLVQIREKYIPVIRELLNRYPERRISNDLAEKLKDPSQWKDTYKELREQLVDQARFVERDQQPFSGTIGVESPFADGNVLYNEEKGVPTSFSEVRRSVKISNYIKELDNLYNPKRGKKGVPGSGLDASELEEIMKEINRRPTAQRELLLNELMPKDADGEELNESELDPEEELRRDIGKLRNREIKDLGAWFEREGKQEPVKPELSFYEKLSAKLDKNPEDDLYVKEEEVRPTLKDFCSRELRKWVTDAYGALVGKGRYNSKGEWVEYTSIDKELDPISYTDATADLTIPAYTFRVTGLPDNPNRTVRRAFNPPPERTNLPSYLQERYRFGITPQLVESMELSDKLKKFYLLHMLVIQKSREHVLKMLLKNLEKNQMI